MSGRIAFLAIRTRSVPVKLLGSAPEVFASCPPLLSHVASALRWTCRGLETGLGRLKRRLVDLARSSCRTKLPAINSNDLVIPSLHWSAHSRH